MSLFPPNGTSIGPTSPAFNHVPSSDSMDVDHEQFVAVRGSSPRSPVHHAEPMEVDDDGQRNDGVLDLPGTRRSPSVDTSALSDADPPEMGEEEPGQDVEAVSNQEESDGENDGGDEGRASKRRRMVGMAEKLGGNFSSSRADSPTSSVGTPGSALPPSRRR